MQDAQQETIQLLAQIWQRNQLQVLDRIDVLERAAQAAAEGSLHATLRADATSIAHKLAGSLGMFGFKEGTRLARELECAFGTCSEAKYNLAELISGLRHSVFPPARPCVTADPQVLDRSSNRQALAS